MRSAIFLGFITLGQMISQNPRGISGHVLLPDITIDIMFIMTTLFLLLDFVDFLNRK